jgi:hypothetical protein
MSARLVLRDRWPSFLESFSRSHEGWLCSIEIARTPAVPAIKARDMPLIAVSSRQSPNGDYAVSFHVGNRAGPYSTHVMREATRVELETNDLGADEGLRVETADGSVTRIRFRAAAVPESLDGMVLSEERGQ